MKAMTTVIAASILSFQGAAVAQESATPTESEPRQGIPATPHQKQTTKEIKSDLFSQLDRNRDGAVSRQEAEAKSALTQKWSTYDKNGDGRLDSQEFSAFEQTSAGDESSAGTSGDTKEGMPATRHQEKAVGNDLVGQLDKDGDGAISQQEAQVEAQLSDNWDQLDRNDDGKLDSGELRHVHQ